jgi:CBS domain-containing membrane protein
MLAGASLRDRLITSIGGMAGIAVTSLVAIAALGTGAPWPLLVAPIGASAVLVFAVPASPLAQPWPVIGGNVVSALFGVAVARLVPVPHLAAGIAVGGAILVMSLLRCLHPPGGAAALTAVIGGPAISSLGFAFAFTPVAVNAVVLVAAGLLFHRLSGHAYPHRPTGSLPNAATRQDIDRALADTGETFDISPEDLELLFQRVEHHCRERQRSGRR